MPLHFPTGDSFQLAPEGTHLAVCYRIVDVGTQRSTYKGQEKHMRKVLFFWELCDELDDDGNPLIVSERYTLSASENARMRKDLEAWRGKKFTQDELETFDIATVIGAGCFLNITHNENGGKTYANVTGVMALPKGTKKPEMKNAGVCVSLEPDAFDGEAFKTLSDNLKRWIAQSPEFGQLGGWAAELVPRDEPQTPPQQQQTQPPPQQQTAAELYDDPDIPF